jgi:hypothetical protein
MIAIHATEVVQNLDKNNLIYTGEIDKLQESGQIGLSINNFIAM